MVEMQNRKTVDKKMKSLCIRITEDEMKFLKKIAIDRGWTLTRFILESIRHYLKDRT